MALVGRAQATSTPHTVTAGGAFGMWKTRVSLVHLFGEENATAGRAQDKVGGVTGTLMQSRT